jgi:hypothetical protein
MTELAVRHSLQVGKETGMFPMCLSFALPLEGGGWG